jgi:hypothetical protein
MVGEGAGQEVVKQADYELKVGAETAIGNAGRGHGLGTAVSRKAREEPDCFAGRVKS